MVNCMEPQGEMCLYTVQDSCLVLNGQMATTHNHTDVEDFPHVDNISYPYPSQLLAPGRGAKIK